ncbi:peroxiredoxin family protein [Phytohabitans rumicis]|uniref:Alkyl hydroperoxide reductase subunit C/ Thiol specific antioxidant domain-containing protein n=1 Tax=Phytohabitans rumicis TaxID=1076125 RepID=A0A6V8L9Z0_9ACTN|nr:TlpA disulfide reductase family protein [Phytohabitans rumicis]GFJ94023.1 hypothetical protein Prum_076650 [Phytohabitans rumicis]
MRLRLTRTRAAMIIVAALVPLLLAAILYGTREDPPQPAQVAEPGQTTLLGFIAISATGADPSQLQVTTLKSMADQYGPAGLRVVIVDTSSADPDTLTNYPYDRHLVGVTLVGDADAAIARRYGVQAAPTTVLIGPDGAVVHRWDGLALSQDLALVIQQRPGMG